MLPFDYDRANLDSMPALYRAWARTSLGEGAARMDLRTAIGDAIRVHNAAASSSTTPVPGVVPPASPDGGIPTGVDEVPVTSMGGGCSCRIGHGAAVPAGLPLILGAIVLGARRLRRRS